MAERSRDSTAEIGRLRRALPTWREAVWGTLLWVAVICGNAAIALASHGWSVAASTPVVLTFLAGSALAFAPGVAAARLLARDRPREVRFALLMLCIAASTVAFTGIVYAVQYRVYYSQWHEAPFSGKWILQFVFTGLIALYQFAAVGLRLMFPLGFVALVVGSFLLSRPAR